MRTLMQFLTVGQSLVDLSSEPQKYAIAKQGWLPKFEPAQEFQLPLGAARSIPKTTPFSKSAGLGASEIKEKREKPVKAANGFNQAIVFRQGELNLDNIKVVRNDFAETDFELKLHGTARSTVLKECRSWSKAPYKAGLNWLAERFFRTSKTQI